MVGFGTLSLLWLGQAGFGCFLAVFVCFWLGFVGFGFWQMLFLVVFCVFLCFWFLWVLVEYDGFQWVLMVYFPKVCFSSKVYVPKLLG